MFLYGRCYDLGDGVEQDYKKAIKWYQKAADEGHIGALVNLGLLYSNGNGTLQDNKKAMELFMQVMK